MTESFTLAPPSAPAPSMSTSDHAHDEACALVLQRYEERIRYYWTAAATNKKWYRITRYLTIVLGALVTLISSFASSSLVGTGWLGGLFAVATPVLAALLTMIGGFSQNFHWDGAWHDMVVTATRLEGERDRLLVVPIDQREPTKEMEAMSAMVLDETRGFFQRMLGKQDGGS